MDFYSTLTAISQASDLDALCAYMNDAGEMVSAAQSASIGAGVIGEIVGDYGRATEDAPTFGGSVPSSTEGVWSWDEDRLLVGEGWGQCEIIDRADWSA